MQIAEPVCTADFYRSNNETGTHNAKKNSIFIFWLRGP